jgi:uncharacterized protein YdcH (DUF465 family)
LQKFSNLRAMRTVTPGRIASMTEKELEVSLRESRAGIEAARRRQEEAIVRQQEAIARQEAAIARHESLVAKHEEIDAEWKEMVRNSTLQTEAIIAELKEHQDERRALLEALFRVMDRLDQQPPPPHLRSV